MSELSPETRKLLVRARERKPLEPAHRAKLKAAVFANIAAASLAATTTASATGGAAFLKILTAFGLGAGLGVGAISLAVYTQTPPSTQPPVVAATASSVRPAHASSAGPIARNSAGDLPPAASVSAAVPSSVSLAAPQPSPGFAESAPLPAELWPDPLPALPSSVPQVAPAAPVDSSETSKSRLAVQEEVRLLRQADAMTKSGDSAGALRTLEEHARRFPASALSPERSLQRILALCAAGRVREAKLEAAPLLAVGGPLPARVLATCAGSR